MNIFPSEKHLTDVITILKMLADPTRLKIILALMNSDKCVNELVELVGPTQSAISHQLNTLKTNNLVKCTKVGNKVVYSVADEHVNQVVNLCLVHAKEIA